MCLHIFFFLRGGGGIYALYLMLLIFLDPSNALSVCNITSKSFSSLPTKSIASLYDCNHQASEPLCKRKIKFHLFARKCVFHITAMVMIICRWMRTLSCVIYRHLYLTKSYGERILGFLQFPSTYQKVNMERLRVWANVRDDNLCTAQNNMSAQYNGNKLWPCETSLTLCLQVYKTFNNMTLMTWEGIQHVVS